jgi:hypothetical protein
VIHWLKQQPSAWQRHPDLVINKVSSRRRGALSHSQTFLDTADEMINLAHNLGSPQDLITYAQIYVQQPRDSDDNTSVVYCQKAPANVELQGLYQCQFDSSSKITFTGGLKLGSEGTTPFGFTSPLNPAGGWYALRNVR